MTKLTRAMTDQEFNDHMIATRPASPVVTDPTKMGKPMDPKDLGLKPSKRPAGGSPSGSKGGVPRVVPGPGDEASRKVRECFSEEELLTLCQQYGIDPVLVTTAPNRGVGKMRVSNALRRILRDSGDATA